MNSVGQGSSFSAREISQNMHNEDADTIKKKMDNLKDSHAYEKEDDDY